MTTAAAVADRPVQDLHAGLMAARRGEPAEEVLACILASWFAGLGVMPAWLGLGEKDFFDMLAHHFPGFDPLGSVPQKQRIDPLRSEESADLRNLLLENRSGRSASEAWMADIVTAGCLGSDHLWQDLGLWNRAQLTGLMRENFAPLAKRNDKDMKWKKFLYRQLCEAEGVAICRSPSCEICVDYAVCFGSE